MPRQARKISSSGIYYVILRSEHGDDIFGDDYEGAAFVNCLAEVKRSLGMRVYAYCLTGNEAHLVVGCQETELATAIRRLKTSYGKLYNYLHGSNQKIFEGRYISSPIENDIEFISQVDRVHRQAGVGALFSSRAAYRDMDSRLVDIDLFYCSFMCISDGLRFLGLEKESADTKAHCPKRQLSDEDAECLISKITGCRSQAEHARLTRADKHENIRKMANHNLSYRQISRITGYSRGMVDRAMQVCP